MHQQSSFYLTLPSNSSEKWFINNKPQSFKVQLAQPLELEGKWEAALMEIQYPNSWYNISETEDVYLHFQELKDGKLDSAFATVRYILRPGNYKSVSDICNLLTKAFAIAVKTQFPGYHTPKWLNMANPVDFYYSSTEACVHIRTNGNYGGTAQFSGNQLPKILGLELDKATKSIFFPTKGTVELSLTHHFPSLYVYCDILVYQIVGDTQVPLLRTVPHHSSEQSVEYVSFIRPYYIPIQKGYISTIEIKICNDLGEEVPFQSGKTILVIHIRKCGIGN